LKRILIPLLVGSLFYGWAIHKWYGQYNQIKPKTQEALEEKANIAQSIINGDSYKAMLSEKTIARTTYDKLVEPLVRLHQSYPDIAHIYTVSRLGPDYYSILDTGPALYKIDPIKISNTKQEVLRKLSHQTLD
jgi:hypothetical protein